MTKLEAMTKRMEKLTEDMQLIQQELKRMNTPEPVTRRTEVKMTETAYAAAKVKAKKQGMNFSEYVRKLVEEDIRV